jgi:hypothetical protein
MNVGEVFHEDEDERSSDEEFYKMGKRSNVKISDIKIEDTDKTPPSD